MRRRRRSEKCINSRRELRSELHKQPARRNLNHEALHTLPFMQHALLAAAAAVQTYFPVIFPDFHFTPFSLMHSTNSDDGVGSNNIRSHIAQQTISSYKSEFAGVQEWDGLRRRRRESSRNRSLLLFN